MGHDPCESVVDENCQVHGVSGLFVAGSSVFPTAGHANPTLMIVALAARLADRLRDNSRMTTACGRLEKAIMTHAGAGGPVTRASADARRLARGRQGGRDGSNRFYRGPPGREASGTGCLRHLPRPGRGRGFRPARRPARDVTRALDLSDEKAVENASQGSGVVFHCAYDWHSGPWNVAAIRALISGCLHHQARRFVHVSTFSVYEQPAAGKFKRDEP